MFCTTIKAHNMPENQVVSFDTHRIANLKKATKSYTCDYSKENINRGEYYYVVVMSAGCPGIHGRCFPDRVKVEYIAAYMAAYKAQREKELVPLSCGCYGRIPCEEARDLWVEVEKAFWLERNLPEEMRIKYHEAMKNYVNHLKGVSDAQN